MAKFRKKLISAAEPLATAAGIRSPVEQLQDLNALSISVVTVCADTSGTDGGLADDTAINTAGGFVKITGTGFRNTSPTTIVYINGVTATYNYLSSTSIVVTVPAATAGTTASLIVFNGSTVGSIWAAGISYSGFPSWTTTAASNLGVVVSTQLVAVGDAPLTYTFISGTLPPNCTISSSGLLSGTVTGVSTNVIYTFTVAVTDAQNQNVSQSIVYTLVVSDFYYRYTSLHISGDSNPTWITDASTNVLAVTPAGAPQSTIFSPLKAGYYGNSFNGSSDYLTTPKTSAMDFGAGDFTVECWIYKSGSSSAGYDTIIQTGTGGSGYYGFTMEASSTRGFAWYTQPGTFILLNYNVSSDDSRWHHFAVSRTGNLTTMFVDGISRATTNAAYTISSVGTIVSIGAESSTPIYFFKGYISNLRAVKGVGLYTANFTPSATPLTAITNTSLLTCQSNRFIDNSASPGTLTRVSAPKVVSSNPFNLPSGLAAYGAGYFNGTTDYVTIPNNAVFALPSDYTIEFWWNPTTISVNADLFCIGDAGVGQNGLLLYYGSDGTLRPWTNNNTIMIAAASAIVANTWCHIALVRSGSGTNNTVLYVNGISIGSATNTTSFTGIAGNGLVLNAAYSGSAYSIGKAGYFSNFRVVKGTAVYTAAFTPPTAPLTAITNTSLLTLQTNVPHNNSQFRDTSTNNALITRYGNTTQGSFSPFTKQYPYSTATVGGSAYFDGTGDYLSMPVPAVGAGNFTAELFVYLNAVSIDEHFFQSNSATNSTNWLLSLDSTTNKFRFVVRNDASVSNADILSSVTAIAGQWYHIAGVVNGTTATLYVNGIALASATLSGTRSGATGTTVYIGQNGPTTDRNLNGYLSNARLTLGTAVYTSNFTPSTTPLTAIPGTVLLMPFTNAAVYDNTMLNNFETVGNAGVSTAVTKYGSASLKFNGTTDYLTIPASANTSFGTGDFTVEFWINTAGANSQILSLASGTAAGNWQVTLYNGNFYWQSARNTTDALYVASASITNSQWHHVAITRTSNTLRIFFDGAQQGSVTDSTNYNVTSVLNIGYSTTYFNGYIDELRITKGFARYTAAFTPSSGAYSVSAPIGTSVLPSKSLRFRRSASAYLSKTFGTPSNNIKWTWSGWVKRGLLSGYQRLFGVGTDASGVNQGALYFDTTNYLGFFQGDGAGSTEAVVSTTALYRDPSAWYHIVFCYDSSNQASSNRLMLYINGVQVTSFSSATYPSINLASKINTNGVGHAIGVLPSSSSNYFDGEMAEVNFVDGLALAPTMFGAYSTYGQWLPISYAGYQGANGFYLPFNAATTTASANYLLVGGGGGGGQVPGGGGGGGGFRTGSSVTLDPTSVYAISVGAGGAGSTATWPSAANAASPGGGSTFNSLTAAGGGRGGADGSVQAAGSGGSGGGASGGYQSFNVAGGAGNTPSTSPSQGNSGGNSSIGYVAGTVAGAGGGGGAGGTGSPGSVIVTTTYAYGTGTSGDGGAGAVSSISGTSVTYAGGGGGGGASATAAQQGNPAYRYLITAGVGGTGGGAAGTTENILPVAATANLGGGGGGSGHTTGYYGPGGAGGSGVVIISYSGTQKFYGGNVTSVGGNTIHTFTTSGSLTGIFGDQSGNNNNWTPNNINVSTPGPTYDLLTDVPTLTSATAANYAVLNPLVPSANTFSNGNLQVAMSTSTNAKFVSTMGVSSGKFYMEFGFSIISNTPIGITSTTTPQAYLGNADGSTSVSFWPAAGSTTIYVNGSLVTWSGSATTWTTSDIAGLALDADNKTIALYKNGVLVGTAFSYSSYWTGTTYFAGGNYISGLIYYANFGQQPFTYTPPANFLALNTYNI